jgi:hypothetical protein
MRLQGQWKAKPVTRSCINSYSTRVGFRKKAAAPAALAIAAAARMQRVSVPSPLQLPILPLHLVGLGLGGAAAHFCTRACAAMRCFICPCCRCVPRNAIVSVAAVSVASTVVPSTSLILSAIIIVAQWRSQKHRAHTRTWRALRGSVTLQRRQRDCDGLARPFRATLSSSSRAAESEGAAPCRGHTVCSSRTSGGPRREWRRTRLLMQDCVVLSQQRARVPVLRGLAATPAVTDAAAAAAAAAAKGAAHILTATKTRSRARNA